MLFSSNFDVSIKITHDFFEIFYKKHVEFTKIKDHHSIDTRFFNLIEIELKNK